MTKTELLQLFLKIKEGQLSENEFLDWWESSKQEKVGDHTHLDYDRARRCGFGEVVYGENKTSAELNDILIHLYNNSSQNVLATRISEDKWQKLSREVRESYNYERRGELIYLYRDKTKKGKGKILIITAGTSDLKVAKEAYYTALLMGNEVELLSDVGVAGIHRLFAYYDKILEARVLIVVAGMEGALPSVIGGLVDKPVIAVPTSVGYGTSFGGIAALLSMLNSCSSGVSVVNIDNGFGAAYSASLINRL